MPGLRSPARTDSASVTTAPSTQPPLTLPTTSPSIETAIAAPGSRGPEPSMSTTRATATRLPAPRHLSRSSRRSFTGSVCRTTARCERSHPLRSDRAVVALPVGGSQVAFEDLAGGRLGERLLTHDDRAWQLVTGDRRPAVVDQLALGRAHAGLQHDLGVDGLAPLWVRHAEHRQLQHCRVAGERILDLGRVDVLAAGHDHVLGAVDNEHVAARVHRREITRAVPTVGGE